jgi:serine/threonine protein kinase/tetratricopeptide (TPR) repeat protein
MSVSARRRRSTPSCSTPDSALALAQRLADELARRWSDGERPSVEEYLSRYPQVAQQPEAALELIYEEMCQQRQAGNECRPSKWLRRFPQWRPQIETLLACHDLLEMADPRPWFPEPGDTFGEFQLLGQLGGGAHGRVYLARQPSLADRPVVLKLASLAGQEHISLARLQHTYIMPLYWAHDDAALGLRALCMPYFGGASLSQVLADIADVPPARRTGPDLLEALCAASKTQPLAPPVQGPVCRLLQAATYVEAICTIGACLAEALDYAHQRNVVHHDLKPSNVLIAADGQPLLLDFHLAQPALEAGEVSISWLGGTPGYMAPEHEAALAAIEARQPIPQRVDGKADIFSLGLLLCEALSGQPPPEGESPARWLRRRNSQVSPALADLVARCTAPEPPQRYPDAGAVASDLRRHLAQQPLMYIANRSLAERWHKWRRRRPYALMAILLVVALLTACLVRGSTIRQQWVDAQQALDEAHTEIEADNFQRAKVALDRGLYLAGELPWRGSLWQDLQTAEVVAEQGFLVQQLHTVVSELRELYGADGLLHHDAQRLKSDARRLWEKRQTLLDYGAVRQRRSQAQLKDDLVALAIFWADLHVRSAAPGDVRSATEEGLAVLDDAERLTGATLILCREQERLAMFLGDQELAAKAARKAGLLKPSSGWEHYALGRIAFAAGAYDQADHHFKAAVDAEPKELWPNFYHGRAAYELKQYEEALTAFAVCVALAHQAPWCYYNRGLANAQLGLGDSARRDFNRALELDPHLAAAALDRGMLSYNEQRYDDALSDLQRAATDGADAGKVAYTLALIYTALGDRAAALRQLEALFAAQPDHEAGRKLAQFLNRDGE